MYSLRRSPCNCAEQLTCSAFYTEKGAGLFPPRYNAVPADIFIKIPGFIPVLILAYNNNTYGYIVHKGIIRSIQY